MADLIYEAEFVGLNDTPPSLPDTAELGEGLEDLRFYAPKILSPLVLEVLDGFEKENLNLPVINGTRIYANPHVPRIWAGNTSVGTLFLLGRPTLPESGILEYAQELGIPDVFYCKEEGAINFHRLISFVLSLSELIQIDPNFKSLHKDLVKRKRQATTLNLAKTLLRHTGTIIS